MTDAVTWKESNVVARTIARRMVERAQEDEDENDEVSERDEENHRLDEEFLLRDGDDPYDSDDPRSFGGEFYWHEREANVSLGKKARDNVRYGCFILYRSAGFILLVLQHFFGLHRSRFQWAVDLVEKETLRHDERVLQRVHRRD